MTTEEIIKEADITAFFVVLILVLCVILTFIIWR